MLPDEIYVSKNDASKFKYSKPINANENAAKKARVRVELNGEELVIVYNNSSENSLALRKKIKKLTLLKNIGSAFTKADKRQAMINADTPSIFNKRSGIKCSKWLADKLHIQYKKSA